MKYSIITINYNNCDGLRQTIESVIHQTYSDYEYIVIDGGSTDGSVELIKEYEDYIDYWVSEPDKGIYHAMNKGILKAHGDYLNFMNSGDFFYDSNVLEKVEPFLTTDIIQGNLYNRTTQQFSYRCNKKITMRFFYESALDHQACFFHKNLFYNSLYDENYKIVSDWLFCMKKIIFENKQICNIPVNVASFEGNGITDNTPQLNIEEREQVLHSLLPPLILSDYEYFKGKDSTVLELIPQFNKTYRLQKLIYHTIKVILYIYTHILKQK